MSNIETDSSEGASERDGVHVVESPEEDGDKVSRQSEPVASGVRNSDQTHPTSAAESTTEDAEAASIEDCAGLVLHAPAHVESDDIEVPLDSNYQEHHDVKAHQQLSHEKGISWHCQNRFLLDHTVLSCSEIEVQEVLRGFMKRQAHAQCMMLRLSLGMCQEAYSVNQVNWQTLLKLSSAF